jgi:hypothetical protein
MTIGYVVLLIVFVPVVIYLLHVLFVASGIEPGISWAAVGVIGLTALSGIWMIKQTREDLLVFIAESWVVLEIIGAWALLVVFGRHYKDAAHSRRVFAWMAMLFALVTTVFNVLGGQTEIRNNRAEDCAAIQYGSADSAASPPVGCSAPNQLLPAADSSAR